MNNYFTTKVKYTAQLENGSFQRVTDQFLFAAMTFTDCEARIYQELAQSIRGEFNVVAINRTEVHDIFQYDDSDTWYKVRLSYDSMDADSSKAKKVTQNFLVSASSCEEASIRIKESLSTLLVDFKIKSVVESPIVEIYPYNDNTILEVEFEEK